MYIFFLPCPLVYLCIKFIGRNQHICVISRKFLNHLSLELDAEGAGPKWTKNLHKTNGHSPAYMPSSVGVPKCVCWPLCDAKMCDRQDLSSNNRHFGQPIDPLVTRCLTLSENIILITDHHPHMQKHTHMGQLRMRMRIRMRRCLHPRHGPVPLVGLKGS